MSIRISEKELWAIVNLHKTDVDQLGAEIRHTAIGNQFNTKSIRNICDEVDRVRQRIAEIDKEMEAGK